MTFLKDIIPVDEAIRMFDEKFPGSDLIGLELKHEGPFLTYHLRGIKDGQLCTYKFNGASGQEIRTNSKDLKPTTLAKYERKILNTENLLDLKDLTQRALERVPVDIPFEWEMERKKDRTIWEIEMADDLGSKVYEVKLDAQDGTILEIELKE